MRSTLPVLALALCLMAVASRSPTDYGIFIAAILLAVIADFTARKRTEPIGWISGDVINAARFDGGSVSSPTVPPSSSLLSSISTPSGTSFEVFLSFRGPDTRNGFTDHLYHRLKDAAIKVFRDDKDLHPGKKVDDALVESIKQSKISIPIISVGYPSSKSCLKELAQMLECWKKNNQLIVPIFYYISPSDLRNQQGGVGQSLRKLEDSGVDRNDLAKWKQALREIAETKGYHLPGTNNWKEAELVKTVVSHILRLLKKNDLVVTDSLVGIEPHVQEVMRKLGVISVNGVAMEVCGRDVRILGISGMPGIGKTTIAKAVYNKISHLFDSCSCLLDFRQKVESNRLMDLQEQLISELQKQQCRRLRTPDDGSTVIANSFSDMKVLILIDDVHDYDQIKLLVKDFRLFGQGSRILMTVRKKDVLQSFPTLKDGEADMTDEYAVEPMRRYQALQLFHNLAFHGYPPKEECEYYSLSIDIVDIIGGLPLAIESTALYLYTIRWNIEIWRETSSRLKMKPDDKVKKAFGISYDYLSEEGKEIFLDVACFSSGMDKRIPLYMWVACDYHPLKEIKCLQDMDLIKIGENNEIRMHSQQREFGRKIVMMENPNEPQKRTRLWSHSDALSMLNGEESAEKVEALCLTFDEGQGECFRCERFGHLLQLRYLRLDQATIEGTSQNVLSNLRWLHWQGCRKISQLLIFHLEKLLILDLSYSLVTGESQEWGQILEKAKGLKVLILSGCPHLQATPCFHSSMSLEILVLEHCPLSSGVSPSIGNLKSLATLNLKFCRSVKHLPEELCDMTALEELLIDGTSIRVIHFRQASMQQLKTLSACQCESLVRISDSIGHLKSLVHLRLDGAAIDRLPDSIGSLKKLQKLLLGNCQKLAELPYSIGNLESLEVLDLSSTMIAILPRSVEDLKNLKLLKMENTLLKEFAKDIKSLEKLEELHLSRCKNLKGPIFCDIKGLISLKVLTLSSTMTSGLPCSDDGFSDCQTFESLSHLQRLDLSGCDGVRALPKLPSSLISLRWGSKEMRTVPDFSYLLNLEELHLGCSTDPEPKSCSEPLQIGWVTSLVNLEILELCHSKIAALPENFSMLQLRKLVLHYANSLDLRELPSSLWTLCLQYCTIQVPQFSKMRWLCELELKHCDLAKIDGLEDLKLLQVLHISHCSVQTLDGLESMPRLRKLTLLDCPSLTELPDPTKYKFEIDMCNNP